MRFKLVKNKMFFFVLIIVPILAVELLFTVWWIWLGFGENFSLGFFNIVQIPHFDWVDMSIWKEIIPGVFQDFLGTVTNVKIWMFILVYNTLLFFAIFNFLAVILMVLTDGLIEKTINEDYRRLTEATSDGTVYNVPRHRFLKLVAFLTHYKYYEANKYKVKQAMYKHLYEPTIENGLVINDKLFGVNYFHRHWEKHLLILGNSKTGKSNDLLNFITSGAFVNSPIVFLDTDVNNAKFISQIGKEFNKRTIIWLPSENNLSYNPFADKTNSNIAELFCYVFCTNESYLSTANTLIVQALEFLAERKIMVDFKILQKYTSVNKLKAEFEINENSALKSKKGAIFRSTLESIDNAWAILEHMHMNLKLFNAVYGEVIKNDENESFSLNNILKSSPNNCILYVGIDDSSNGTQVALLQKLFYKDMLMHGKYNEVQRGIDMGTKKKLKLEHQNFCKTLFCFAGMKAIFTSPDAVKNSLKTMTSVGVCLAADLSIEDFITPSNAPIVRTLMSECGTIIAHKLSDEGIKADLKLAFAGCSIVSPGFQIERMKSIYAPKKDLFRAKEHMDKNKATEEAKIASVKNSLIDNLSFSGIGEIIFKTYDELSNVEGFEEVRIDKSILYSKTFTSIKHASYLLDASKIYRPIKLKLAKIKP
ncbi:MAG: hypothetical protein LBC44_01070 [Mycoplasmataceae bacterium]|nr:hypothetical protein [Mycoplasmataceae bacterium]